MRRIGLCLACLVIVAVGCDEDNVCQNGAVRCFENNKKVYWVCRDGDWKLAECEAGYACDQDQGSCRPSCSADERRCSGTLKNVEICSNGQWVVETPCGAQEYCDSTQFSCHEPTTLACTPASKRCENNVVMICNGTGWQVYEACVSPQTCDQLTGTCVRNPECTTGSKKCDDDLSRVLSCVDGFWAVDKTCTGGQCNPDDISCIVGCKEGARKCSDTRHLLKCIQNRWMPDQTCGTNEYCNAEKASCVKTPECVNGTSACDLTGKYVKFCENEEWRQDTCAAGKECVNGQCIKSVYRECTDATYSCKGAVLRQCKDNVWVEIKECSGAKPMCSATKGDCVDSCDEGALKCSSTRKTLMVCKDNAWVEETACYQKDMICMERNGVAACEASVCSDGVTCKANTLRVCQGNTYTVEQTCLSSQTCDVSSKSCVDKPECAKGEYKCESQVLYSCSAASRWQKDKTCVNPQICDASSGKCVDTSVCSNGQYYCNGQILNECSGGKWVAKETCDSLHECKASTKRCELRPVCTDGTYSCNGMTLRICQSGQWQDSKTCTNTQTCSVSLKKCADCTEDEVRCNGSELQKCTSGAWKKQETCGTGKTCNADLAKCIECSGDVWQCSSQRLQRCSDNLWNTQKTCDSTSYCDASQKTCVKKDTCESGKYACENTKLKKCVSGQWQDYKTCTAQETCDSAKGKCVPQIVCTKGDTACDGNSLKTCNSEGQWKVTPCGDQKLCVTENKSSSCVATMKLPEWCNIQYVDNNRAVGYSRVLLPDGILPGDITAQFVCGDVKNPIASWTFRAPAVHDPVCTDCYLNTEFMSYSLNADAGTYRCTFTYKFGPQTIACLPDIEGGTNGGEPVVLSDSTKLTEAQTMEIVVPPASKETPPWCHFKHLDDNNAGGTWRAFGRIFPPGATVPSQITGSLICGSKNTPAANWTIMRSGTQNLFCPRTGNDACGESNLEYQTEPLIDGEHSLGVGTYYCAFRFDIKDGKSYICPTDASKGTNVRELKPGEILETEGDAGYTWGFTI